MGSYQLKGTDHGNCSSSMKLPSGVAGNLVVEAWECNGVSRNASEPDSASLRNVEVASLPTMVKPDKADGEATGECSRQISRGGWGQRAWTDQSRSLGGPAG